MPEDYESTDFKSPLKTSAPTPALVDSPRHHGDVVRKLLFIAGMIMLATLPFLHQRSPTPTFLSVIFILVLTFSAGLTNPRHKWNAFGSSVIAIVGFVIFAFSAITKFETIFDLLFATNMTLSCIFLFAFYLSIRAFRGHHTEIEEMLNEKISIGIPEDAAPPASGKNRENVKKIIKEEEQQWPQ